MYAGQCGSLVARTASRRGSCGPRRRTIPDRFVDLHTHILPSIDDGTSSLAEARSLAAAAFGEGTVAIAATPHVRDDYPTSVETMLRGVAEVREALAVAGIPLDVRPGGELALDRLGTLPVEELRGFGLGGNPRYLLVECPYYGWPLDLANRLFKLTLAGIIPVLAHPERNPEVQERPELVQPLVEAGTLVQLTAASLDGRLGRRARATGLRLLALRLAHLLASDAHAPSLRAVGLAAARRAVRDDTLGEWLARAVPRAIVASETLPDRPKGTRRSRFLRLR